MDIMNLTAKISEIKKPIGTIMLSGAKNSATRLLAASMLCDQTVELRNFPTELIDAVYKIDFIKKSGGRIIVNNENNSLNINFDPNIQAELECYDYPIRTTYLLAAGLIKRFGLARIPYPGGCKIGYRGYDLHLMVWRKFGAEVTEKRNYIEIKANRGFIPAEIIFTVRTIGGTENALVCASIVEGISNIRNAYISPEVEDLINFLRSMGVTINISGNSNIIVKGIKNLKGSVYTVMPDRIEAITWIIYGILSGGDITIENIPFSAMTIPLIYIRNAGVDFYSNSKNIRVSKECLSNGTIQPFELATGTHPGIISDMQPFYVLLALYGDGISRIYDYRYPERVKYLEELSKFYPNQLIWEKGKITIYGNPHINPISSNVQSTDLRGSMVLLLASLLCKDGESIIKNVEMALRGYNNLVDKLKKIGININISN